VPAELSGDETALTIHNLTIADAVNAAGRSYVTPAVLKGRQMIRVSIGAQATERRHVEGVWAELRAAAGEPAAAGSTADA
jgi:aromatic-L-amino-acid decarboxylase